MRRIKIKHMEIAIIKRESTGTGSNTYNENETVAKFEIMDGAPVRGEPIPAHRPRTIHRSRPYTRIHVLWWAGAR